MKKKLLYLTLFCVGISAFSVQAKSSLSDSIAEKVKSDFADRKGAEILHYSVPAMSETQYLPNVYPEDGLPGVPVRIIAAGGEYEPGSFLLYTGEKLGKLSFEVEDLKNKDGLVFPKSALDLKVVKVWYQNGNGWFSYFQDNGLKLCPELLLNDEELIKVDTEKVANYARLTEEDGSVSYRWLTPPRDVDNRIEDAPGYRLDESFCAMKPNFKDAETFQGATLVPHEFKQFFLTAHVTDQKPGLYTGNITLKNKKGKVVGKVPVELRVLPFKLPEPKTYFDLDKDFLVFFCEYVSFELIRQINGNDPELAEKQMKAILENFVAHNEKAPSYREVYTYKTLARDAGMDLSRFVYGSMTLTDIANMKFEARRAKEAVERDYGPAEQYYMGWGDEYGLSILRAIRPMIDIYKGMGFKFPVNSRHGYSAGGYLADLFWPPIWPEQSSQQTTTKFHFLGGDTHIGWYATQHVGVENPAYIRRQYGFGPYRAGFSVHYNYAHHLNGYNDIRGNTYKSMNFVYGDGNGVIDTLAWEGFREGMDDIRYATLLQQLARPLVDSVNLRAKYAAKKALQLLADMDTESFDQTTARLEIIRHILTLQSYSNKE